jgi:hypothetical protein
LSDVASFGLSRKEAIPIPRTMQQTVKETWEDPFRSNGLTAVEIERLRTCFIACDEKLPAGGDETV